MHAGVGPPERHDRLKKVTQGEWVKLGINLAVSTLFVAWLSLEHILKRKYNWREISNFHNEQETPTKAKPKGRLSPKLKQGRAHYYQVRLRVWIIALNKSPLPASQLCISRIYTCLWTQAPNKTPSLFTCNSCAYSYPHGTWHKNMPD